MGCPNLTSTVEGYEERVWLRQKLQDRGWGSLALQMMTMMMTTGYAFWRAHKSPHLCFKSKAGLSPQGGCGPGFDELSAPSEWRTICLSQLFFPTEKAAIGDNRNWGVGVEGEEYA